MADMLNNAVDTDAEKKRLKEERNKLKSEQKAQKKEAKKRAKEIAAQEAELDEEAGGLPVFFVTLIIVIIWVAILCVLIKLDVGSFGSRVLAPVIKDVPVLNKILPTESVVTTDDEESYGGYTSLRDAVDYITELELELERAQSLSGVDAQRIDELEAEVDRLRTFESAQVDFDRIRTEFYEEVIYAEKGPGAEEYRKYYEEIDPTYAEYLYKQVVEQAQVDAALKDYAQPFADMEPAAAAKILENMTGDPELAAKILMQLTPAARGQVLAAMDAEFAARLTRIMDPE
ncbi:MAG: hypothetical protein K2N85_01115 [Lachnospiraceae bacterium]|nr:hypothetical protein [Lachnospiraceae bacterium]